MRDLLGQLDVPYLVIPGNHDDRENHRAAFADHGYLPKQGPLHYCIDDYAIRIIGLDSTVPGKHHGHRDAEPRHGIDLKGKSEVCGRGLSYTDFSGFRALVEWKGLTVRGSVRILQSWRSWRSAPLRRADTES